jgi:hypothetical protein
VLLASQGTYTILKRILTGKVVNTALATAKDPKGNDVTDETAVTIHPPHSINSNPSIALVKTAAVGGTGKVG